MAYVVKSMNKYESIKVIILLVLNWDVQHLQKLIQKSKDILRNWQENKKLVGFLFSLLHLRPSPFSIFHFDGFITTPT